MADASTSRVLVLDDDRDFCELLDALLQSATGVETVAVHSLAELVRRRDEALACDLAILDVNLGPGQPSGIDALEWLRLKAFAGRIVFLTGHARRHPLLSKQNGIQIFEKPVDADVLLSVVRASSRQASVGGP